MHILLIGSRNYWRLCNSLLKMIKSTVSNVLRHFEELSCITECLAQRFSSISTLDHSRDALPKFALGIEPLLSDMNITASVVFALICHLQPTRLADSTVSIFLKKCDSQHAPVLNKFYKKCLAVS